MNCGGDGSLGSQKSVTRLGVAFLIIKSIVHSVLCMFVSLVKVAYNSLSHTGPSYASVFGCCTVGSLFARNQALYERDRIPKIDLCFNILCTLF